MKKIISLLLCFTLICGMPFTVFAASNTALAQTLAEDLKELNLFYGVSDDNNFDLERAPTRVEALVMLIRVLGAEKEALNGTWEHPFTDVPAWADKYVGYGYENGLANGVGYTTFGTGRANAAMYLTFVLRSLGYTESEDNFTWDSPFELARKVGILTSEADSANFLRGDVVLVSYAALNVELKGQTKTLAEKLIEAGVFTKQVFDAYYDANALTVSDGAMTSEEIYEKCSPAVFYIEISDASGKAVASGSGFFISADGIAVTNYHVIDGASSAKITLSDTQKTYSVEGVLSYSKEEDWAVIKVDAENLPYMEVGDTSTIVGGAEIFAIGSPLGLQNTISQGIISNVSRTIEGTEYIQITAAISHGSSGGALINKYGEVIGITSATIESGQNINLAVPISKIKNYKGVAVKGFASVTGAGSTPTKPSGSSSNARVSADDPFEVLYKIATEHNTFDYGDYIGWSGISDEGDEELDVVYSLEYDMLFIDYTYSPADSSNVCDAFITIYPDKDKDGYIFTLKTNGNEIFKSQAQIDRKRLDVEYIIPLDKEEYSRTLTADTVDVLKTDVQSSAAWLAIAMLDEVMNLFTNGEWSVADLGYVNLYN